MSIDPNPSSRGKTTYRRRDDAQEEQLGTLSHWYVENVHHVTVVSLLGDIQECLNQTQRSPRKEEEEGVRKERKRNGGTKGGRREENEKRKGERKRRWEDERRKDEGRWKKQNMEKDEKRKGGRKRQKGREKETKREEEKRKSDRTQSDRTQSDRTQSDRTQSDRTQSDRTQSDRTQSDREIWIVTKTNDSPGLGLLCGDVQLEILHVHGTVRKLGKAEVRAPCQGLPTPRQLEERWYQVKPRHASEEKFAITS